MESDSQLVARAQDGDQQAFAELVRLHSALVFRLAVSILGREFIPEAEDVAQDVFLKVHHAIKSFRSESEFSSWIYRIAFASTVVMHGQGLHWSVISVLIIVPLTVVVAAPWARLGRTR